MLNFLKRKCAHCGQRSIGVFLSPRSSRRCPNCNGLVKENGWRSGTIGGLLGAIL